MVWRERLHQHFASQRSTSRAAGYLRQKLKSPFRRAEIGNVQSHVGIHHADQRDVGEVKPLGDHLRAQENVDQTATKGVEDAAVAARPAHRITVHPANDVSGELLLDLYLQLLRAQSLVTNLALAALRA